MLYCNLITESSINIIIVQLNRVQTTLEQKISSGLSICKFGMLHAYPQYLYSVATRRFDLGEQAPLANGMKVYHPREDEDQVQNSPEFGM